mmetsp:Transcript_122867/g.223503  ORF Transcript_122867/g.223503 Transcript_122867/m.223503 type:complete len:117 (+) Transcript_122867:1697-2047(+)
MIGADSGFSLSQLVDKTESREDGFTPAVLFVLSTRGTTVLLFERSSVDETGARALALFITLPPVGPLTLGDVETRRRIVCMSLGLAGAAVLERTLLAAALALRDVSEESEPLRLRN